MEEIKYLVLTLLIELPVAWYLLHHEPWQKVLLATIGVNLISHHIGWWFLYFGTSWWSVEIGVTIFEVAIFLLLFRNAKYRAILTAITINIASALFGVLFL
jgi:hypothetical protein